MTKYLQKSFSVASPGTEAYRNNWDAIDWSKKSSDESVSAIVPNLTDIHSMVHQFHEVYELPIAEAPAVPSDERVRLRLDLISEEFFELLEATLDTNATLYVSHAKKYVEDAIRCVPCVPNLPAIADALGDIAYVVEGANLEFGIPGKKVLEAIHVSNLTKLGEDGKPLRREDGKVMKGPNYKKPDIESALDQSR